MVNVVSVFGFQPPSYVYKSLYEGVTQHTGQVYFPNSNIEQLCNTLYNTHNNFDIF